LSQKKNAHISWHLKLWMKWRQLRGLKIIEMKNIVDIRGDSIWIVSVNDKQDVYYFINQMSAKAAREIAGSLLRAADQVEKKNETP
jgi:hypothetical protein